MTKRLLIILLAALILAATLEAREKEPAVYRGRAVAWEQNCGRCHNLRSPTSYSDSQWDLILVHMRIRGTLTAEEAKAILELMKAGN